MINRLNTLLSVLLCSFVFFACEKEEVAIQPNNNGGGGISNPVDTTTQIGGDSIIQIGPGLLTVSSVDVEGDYKYQVFYDLETNKEISRNLKTVWDLAFETSATGNHVVLNSSKAMQVYHTGSTDFSIKFATPKSGWVWDEPSGNLDSTAIGDWEGKNEVYVIDLGYDEKGQLQGYKKMVIESITDGIYKIKYADLDGSNTGIVSITKDTDYNYVFFSFTNGGNIVTVEPPKEDWDLVFTQYTQVFHNEDPATYYLVTGVIQNRYNTTAKVVEMESFANFSLENTNELILEDRVNVLGYDWKKYDYDSGTYTIFVDKYHVVKDSEGNYYKLRFLDFYNELGSKGKITFEYQRL
ncbi:MAG: hypothetical protein GY827_03215 [Cytophagales bacterium]|nr:hypothetical protein [Cytophagales bacterium]